MPILLGVWLVGCGPPAGRGIDPARQRWEETGKRCRGELLLVDGDGPKRLGAPDRPVRPGGHTTSAVEVPPGAIRLAREFTVAVRARGMEGQSPLAAAGPTSAGDRVNRRDRLLSRGSGIIIDRSGLILTNDHVIRGSSVIEVYLPDVGWQPAKVVGSDSQSDLAVIDVGRDLQVACRFENASLATVGQPVAAVGAGLSGSSQPRSAVLVGRLRARRRCLQGALDPSQRRFYAAMLESTIPLPQGFSGGPLVDYQGRVIGINTAAATDHRTGAHLGYAIPVSDGTRSIVARLARGRPVDHGYLGMLVRAPRAGSVARGMATGSGVVVERVLDRSPAARAGLRSGDIITGIDHVPVNNAAQLAERVYHTSPGTHLSIEVSRTGRPLTLAATPIVRLRRPASN